MSQNKKVQPDYRRLQNTARKTWQETKNKTVKRYKKDCKHFIVQLV